MAKKKVAHIISRDGTMATKLAIKDVRVKKLPLDTSNALCKLIPDKLPDVRKRQKAKNQSAYYAISCIPELQQAEASPNPILRGHYIRYAKMLEVSNAA